MESGATEDGVALGPGLASGGALPVERLRSVVGALATERADEGGVGALAAGVTAIWFAVAPLEPVRLTPPRETAPMRGRGVSEVALRGRLRRTVVPLSAEEGADTFVAEVMPGFVVEIGRDRLVSAARACGTW